MLGGPVGRLATGAQAPLGPIRLCTVMGFQNRVNDVVYCPPLLKLDPTVDGEEATAVVYFGGDVQDYPENMESNRDSKSYMKYNLESTAQLLRNGFPKSHILVIRPARMEFKTFSCFDNFVRGNNAGVPDHTPMHHSLQHLEKLLTNVSHRLKIMPEVDLISQAVPVIPISAPTTPEAVATSPPSTVSSDAVIDTSQDMDIDILQVQETVTVNNFEAVIYEDNIKNSITMPSMASEILPELLHDSFTAQSTMTTVTSTSTTTTNASSLSSSSSSSSSDDLQPATPPLDPLWWRDSINLDKAKLILIGFSKGCVVLNQFIYEFHYLKTLTPDDSSMIRLLSRIKDMYWLDGGHGGAKNTWITSRSLLETLTRLGINIHIHVTPYQVQDDRRPWIRKEEKTFTELLRRLGAPLSRFLHFDSAIANLFTHFEVLQVFRQPSPQHPTTHIDPPKDGVDEK